MGNDRVRLPDARAGACAGLVLRAGVAPAQPRHSLKGGGQILKPYATIFGTDRVLRRIGGGLEYHPINYVSRLKWR
jgi:hypothetical protein